MATNPNSMVQKAVDAAISKRGEIGLQVVAYVDGKQVVDVWGGLACVLPDSPLMLVPQVGRRRRNRCAPSPRRSCLPHSRHRHAAAAPPRRRSDDRPFLIS